MHPTKGTAAYDEWRHRQSEAKKGKAPGNKGKRYPSPPHIISKRFWSKVDKSGDCWLWIAGCYPNGYGQFAPHHGEKGALAHRFAWELTYGAIPDDLLVCHHCDTPACVRPDHLFLGTQSDNVRDCVAKGRHSLQNPANHHRKLTEIQVYEIRYLYAQGVSKAQLGRRYHTHLNNITNVVSGQTWKHLTDAPVLNITIEDPDEIALCEALRADRISGMTIKQLAKKYHFGTERVVRTIRGEPWE